MSLPAGTEIVKPQTASWDGGARLLPWLVAVAFFMESLDSTILNTAVPAIAGALGVAPLNMKSVLASYTLSLAMFIPLSGWMANRFGTRRVFASAIAIFTLGSVLCGLCRDIDLLVACRMLQGFGGALMLPVGRLTILRTFPKSELIRAMAFAAMPGLVGPMIGPLAGGLIVSYFHWSAIFFVNLPIGVLGLIMVYRYMPDFRTARAQPLDIGGLLLFGGGIALLSYLIDVVDDRTLRGLEIAEILAASSALLIAFGLQTRQAAHPLLHFALLKYRSFRIALAGNLCTRIGIGGVPFLLSLLYQVGLGWTPIRSGLAIMPQAVAAMGLKFTVPVILRTFGYRRVLIANTGALGLLIVLLSTIDSDTSVWLIGLLSFVFGYLASLQFTGMNTLYYADIAEQEASGASTIASTVQQLALSFGVAAASIAAIMFIPHHLHARPAQVVDGIHLAMRLLGTLTVGSALIYRGLRISDGACMSRAPASPGACERMGG